MHYKQLVSAVAVAWGASSAVAFEHGELATFAGKEVRWHQLARGYFTGVPAHHWNNTIHTRSEQEWDIDEIVARSSYSATTEMSLGARDLELEARNLNSACQAIVDCVRDYGGAWVVSKGYVAYVAAAEYAVQGTIYKDLMEFLNQPFVANAGGVAIAGVISGQINEATKKECSTSGSESDVIGAAIAAAIAAKPSATEVAVTVNGPSGSWTITVSAGAENTKPTTECTA